MIGSSRVFIVASIFVLSTNVEAATFQGLGRLYEGADFGAANAVSADGQVVVGSSGRFAFRWTAADGMVELESIWFGLDAHGQANAVTADGTVAVGANGSGFYSSSPVRWETADNPDIFDSSTFGSAQALDISGDGSVIVGSTDFISDPFGTDIRAFRWSSATGLVRLPDGTVESRSCVARGVSADGSVVVGNCLGLEHEAVMWIDDLNLIGLGYLHDVEHRSSQAHAISADGSTIVGQSSGAGEAVAFRWTAEQGMRALGELPGGLNWSPAYGVSADGSLIVGSSSSTGDVETAFLWDAINGMRSLHTILTENYGIELGEWHLLAANDISDDGRSIVGRGTNPNEDTEPWMVRLPKPGDANEDEVVDSADYEVWSQAFGMLSPLFENGDFNTDGLVNAADYTVWANRFDATEDIPMQELTSSIAAVPEPPSIFLGVTALAALVWLATRERPRQFGSTLA